MNEPMNDKVVEGSLFAVADQPISGFAWPCFACKHQNIDCKTLHDYVLVNRSELKRLICERGVTDKNINITWPLTIWLMDQINEKISRIFGKPTPDGIHQFKQDLFAAIRERGVTCEKCEALTDMNAQLQKRLPPEPPPARYKVDPLWVAAAAASNPR